MNKLRRPGAATILNELRRELKGRGVRVVHIAAELGVAEPTVWRWLRGDGLTLDRLDEICAIAGLDLRDLLGRAEDSRHDRFTLAQERILAADRGLALVFFAILHGAQRRQIEQDFRLPRERLDAHLERLKRLGLIDYAPQGRLRPKTRRTVQWRRGGPLSIAFERTVKPLFMSMDFGSAAARYISDIVPLSATAQTRIHAMFEDLRSDIHVLAEQEAASRVEGREWSGILMMVRPFDIEEMTGEWNLASSRLSPPD